MLEWVNYLLGDALYIIFALPAHSDTPRRNTVSAALRQGTRSVQDVRDHAERGHEQYERVLRIISYTFLKRGMI